MEVREDCSRGGWEGRRERDKGLGLMEGRGWLKELVEMLGLSEMC